MVGVPGKSKGCITCKRRKVGCDLEKPFCLRCRKSQRKCEGYAKYSTYVNRTVQDDKAGTSPSESLVVSNEVVNKPSDVQDVSGGATLPAYTQIRMGSIFDRALMGFLMDIFQPQGLDPDLQLGKWFLSCLNMVSTQPAVSLKLALRALGITRIARSNNDQTLLAQGYATYGSALQALQHLLYDDRTKWGEETVATTRILAAFGLIESPASPMRDWATHSDALQELVRARGPVLFRRSHDLGYLHGMRYTAMVNAIMAHKSSFLGTTTWLNKPWEGRNKSWEDKLLDQGFALAGVIEAIERVFKLAKSGYNSVGDLSGCISRLIGIDDQLSSWLQAFETNEQGPLFWRSFDMLPSDEASKGVYAFKSLEVGQLVTHCWTFQLMAAAIIADTIRTIGGTGKNSGSGDGSIVFTRQFLEHLVSKYGGSRQVELADAIVCGCAWTTNPGNGLPLLQRMLFPLGTAVAVLDRYKKHCETEWELGALLLRRIATRDHVNLAHHLFEKRASMSLTSTELEFSRGVA